MKLLVLAVLGLIAGAAAQDHADLVTFDGADGTTFHWQALNDPVMGGLSHSEFKIDTANKTAKWVGETKIVPKLSAPGFCNAKTTDGLGVLTKFTDLSAFTHLEIRARSFIPYDGWKVSFAADTLNPTFASFKANFNLTADGKWHTIAIPFSSFSNDWSPFTGDCSTKDPTGKQHKCCSAEHPEVCPTKKNLADIHQMGFWTEGVAGNFSAEFQWVRGGFGDTCSASEFCCPEAQHCLTPSAVSCAADEKVCDGTAYPVCCPLTKVCVAVGNPCTHPCEGSDNYCCPVTKSCTKPSNPGAICKGNNDCSGNDVCCPVTNLCVSLGDQCSPFDPPAAPFWPPQSAQK